MKLPAWKPAACTDCGAPWPSWSLTGPTGPWRCMSCNTVAARHAPTPVRVERSPDTNPQGTLL